MMPILFLLSLETGGQSGQVGEALRINGFRRPLTKNTMWAPGGQVGAKWDVSAWFRPLAHFGKMQVGAVFRPYSLE